VLIEHQGSWKLGQIVKKMLAMLRAEQDDMKQILAERALYYPGPPQQPGVF
jgi:hypothetical protein